MVDDHHFTVLDVPDKAGTDHVQGTGFRRQDGMAIQVAQDQRPYTERVSNADQLLVGDRHQGIAALDLPQGVDEPIHEAGPAGPRDEVQDDLGVRGGLEDPALRHQLLAQGQEVGEVAVVGQGDAACIQIGEHGLDVSDDAAARR